jgi:hypothetical protein
MERVRRGPPNAVRHHGKEKEEEEEVITDIRIVILMVIVISTVILFLLLLFLGHPFASCIQGSEVLGLPPVIGYFRGLHPLETPSGKAPMTILHRTFFY